MERVVEADDLDMDKDAERELEEFPMGTEASISEPPSLTGF